MSPLDVWDKSVLSSGNSKSKGPETGVYLKGSLSRVWSKASPQSKLVGSAWLLERVGCEEAKLETLFRRGWQESREMIVGGKQT